MEKSELQSKIKEILEVIFKHLEIEFSLEESENFSSDRPYFNIKSTDDSLLVGCHGSTLNSLQYIVNIFLTKNNEDGTSITLDVGDYRKNREIKLRETAMDAAMKVRELNKSISLYPMSSYERRVVHEVIGTIDGLTSYSEGEGPERKVIIALK